MSGQFGTPLTTIWIFMIFGYSFLIILKHFTKSVKILTFIAFFWQTKSLLDTPAIQKRTQKNDKTLGKKPRQEHEWKKYLKFFMAINQTITSSLWFIGEGSCARRQTRIFREQCFFKPFICLTLILFGFCRFLDDKDQVWPLTQFFYVSFL